MNAEDACREIHQVVGDLRVFDDPKQVALENGVYSFNEAGQTSLHGPKGRIVRVGTHPLADGRLRKCLQEHYNNSKDKSVFLRLLGGALLKADFPNNACLKHWPKLRGKKCEECAGLEEMVSNRLRQEFTIRCVEVTRQSERKAIEWELIATIAQCTVCNGSDKGAGASFSR